MAKRSPHHRRAIEDLRLTIDCMPQATREAMLSGVRASERIIVGAYTDDQGGECPMLAAHRCGGRTNFLSFAISWDRFTRAGRRSRRATARELAILVDQLEGSLTSEARVDLDRAIEEHRELTARHRRSAVVDPSGEIVVRRLGRIAARRLHTESLGRGGERRQPSSVSSGG